MRYWQMKSRFSVKGLIATGRLAPSRVLFIRQRFMKPLSSPLNESLTFISLIFAICAIWMSPAYAREIRDATGERVVLVDRPVRIVTLAPSLGELAADLLGEPPGKLISERDGKLAGELNDKLPGEPNQFKGKVKNEFKNEFKDGFKDELSRIVGVTEYTDYPPALKKVASIGSYVHLNLEKILSLKPDLVFGTLDGNRKDEIVHLRELGIPVILVRTGSFDGIEDSIRLVALALNKSSEAKPILAKLNKGLSQIRERAKTHPSKKVMLQVGDDPLIVVGQKSFLHDAISLVGASNIYANADENYPRPSLEDVLSRDPDFIVVTAMGADVAPYKKMVEKWKQFPKLSAVKNKRVLLLEADALLRPTARILEGLIQFEQAIYGKN